MSVLTAVIKGGVYFISFTCYNWLPLIEFTKVMWDKFPSRVKLFEMVCGKPVAKGVK